MAEVEIGFGKSGRRGYGLDDIAVVPSRRTRDPEDVDVSWELDAFRFALPVLGAPSDAVTSPASAVALGGLGGLGVLNLEGLWTRYEDPAAQLQEIGARAEAASRRQGSCPADPAADSAWLRALYDVPVQAELVTRRLRELKSAGVLACGAVSPQRTRELLPAIVAGECDLLVIQGRVVSAEHVSRAGEPLNLKRFVRELDVPVLVGGCASYQTALHLMRTGAAGVLVGVGATLGARRVLGVGVPQATAIADAAGARMRHLDETGVYCHVIAAGGVRSGGDIAKAVACGADAAVLGSPLAAAHEAPGRGAYWELAAAHPRLPRGRLSYSAPIATLAQVLLGPACESHGRSNLVGALRTAMATCGYQNVKELQKADVVVTPAAADDAGAPR